MQKDEVLHVKEVNQDEIWLDKRELNRHYLFFGIKRSMDIVGSVLGLIITLPIIIWAIRKIRQEEPGSPIFLIKFELEKMVELLRCISSGLCVLTQKIS